MPNHITNTMEIYIWHDTDKTCLARFLRMIESDDHEVIDFEKIIDPADDPEYTEAGWYGWNVINWGTKWNSYDASVLEVDEYSATLQFDTAWSPPEPIFARLEEMLEKEFPSEDGHETYIRGAWIEEGYQSAGVF